jgi:hypothetical protein
VLHDEGVRHQQVGNEREVGRIVVNLIMPRAAGMVARSCVVMFIALIVVIIIMSFGLSRMKSGSAALPSSRIATPAHPGACRIESGVSGRWRARGSISRTARGGFFTPRREIRAQGVLGARRMWNSARGCLRYRGTRTRPRGGRTGAGGARGRLTALGSLGARQDARHGSGAGTLRGSLRRVNGRIGDRLEIERQRVIERGVELIDDLAHRVRPLAAVLGQHAHDQRTQQWRNLPRRHEFRHRLFLRPAQIEMRIVRRITGKQLVSKGSQPVDVVGLGGRLATQLLGTGGEWREPLQAGRRCAGRCGASGTKVRQLHAATRIKQNIAGLQVAMDDPALVRVLQRLCDIQEHRDDVQVTGPTQAAQIPARGELHGQHHRVSQVMRGKYLQCGSMIQTTRDRVLALKGGQYGLAGSSCGVGYLQRNVDAADVVVGAPDFALSARTQFLEQSKARVQTVTSEGCCELSHDLLGPETSCAGSCIRRSYTTAQAKQASRPVLARKSTGLYG